MAQTLWKTMRPVLGVLVCAGAAASSVALFGRHPAANWLPIVFLAVVFLVAIRFGTMVGILGSLAAAVVFAYLLFPPMRSVAVTDPAARGNIAWMLLGGTIISFLLAPGPQTKH
jgi:K+-sensing histidine kinase KdpD